MDTTLVDVDFGDIYCLMAEATLWCAHLWYPRNAVYGNCRPCRTSGMRGCLDGPHSSVYFLELPRALSAGYFLALRANFSVITDEMSMSQTSAR